jgi:outer membrane protein assembly factor BamB
MRLAAALAGGLCASVALASDWSQWGRTAQHGGAVDVAGQPLEAIAASIVYDPFVDFLKQVRSGNLLVHYPVPLVDQDGFVYMSFKSGSYQFDYYDDFSQVTWSIRKLRLTQSGFQTVWEFESDWKPASITLAQWESVFQAAIAGDALYVPGAGGTMFRVSKATGAVLERLNPFPTVDPSCFTIGGPAVDAQGRAVYNVLQLDPNSDPRDGDPPSWLVRVTHGGVAEKIDYVALVPGAPPADGQCQTRFPRSQLPWPPSPDAVAPTARCGAQRAGVNVVPAVAPDGTIYTLSRAHSNSRYSYLVAVGPDLSPKWAASFRGILNDGCGVLLPIDDIYCRAGAHIGIDPGTNDRPAPGVVDAATSSPVVLPDGRVLVGGASDYNFGRGHLFEFDPLGNALSTYDFGWDITPAVFPHDGTYSILIKDNTYGSTDGELYYDVTSLDANLHPEWSFRGTRTESCTRQPSGEITCVDDHEYGFEWCVNQPAVDIHGNVYLNSEDGYLYAFDQQGHMLGEIFLDTALGASYTPISIGPDGTLYAQNNGVLFAVGRERPKRGRPHPPTDAGRAPRVLVRE